MGLLSWYRRSTPKMASSCLGKIQMIAATCRTESCCFGSRGTAMKALVGLRAGCLGVQRAIGSADRTHWGSRHRSWP